LHYLISNSTPVFTEIASYRISRFYSTKRDFQT